MINIVVTKSRMFRWFVPVLLASPLVLLWGLRKFAWERPHFVAQKKLAVKYFFFPEGEQTACVGLGAPGMSMEHFACWNTRDWKETSNPPVTQHRGLLKFSYPSRPFLKRLVWYSFNTSPNASSGHGYKSAFAAFSNDGRQVTLAGSDVSRWDLKTGKCLWTTPLKGDRAEGSGAYRAVTEISPDGALCAIYLGHTESDSQLAIMECRSGKIIAHLPSRDSFQIAFTPDNQSVCLWKKNEIRFFDAHTARALWETARQSNSIMESTTEPHFTTDGCVVLPRSNGFDFLDVRTGKLKRHFSSPFLSHVEAWNFSPDGKQLWWSNPKHQIFYRDLE